MPVEALAPLQDQERILYEKLATDPVAFFLAAEKAGKVLVLSDILNTLRQFRARASQPSGSAARLDLKKSTTDADLVAFTEAASQDERYYVGLFRIIRRLGFSVSDCISVLLNELDLARSRGDLSAYTAMLETVRAKIDADTALPPSTRGIAAAPVKVKN